MKLTEKQKRFVEYYIQTGGNASEAARLAGYAERTAPFIGAENLKKSNIKETIQEKLKEQDEKRTADTKEILQYMTSVMRGEVEEEVVAAVGTGDGRFEPKIVIKKVGVRERNKCAEMLARVHGLFNDKINVNGQGEIKIIDDIMGGAEE